MKGAGPDLGLMRDEQRSGGNVGNGLALLFHWGVRPTQMGFKLKMRHRAALTRRPGGVRGLLRRSCSVLAMIAMKAGCSCEASRLRCVLFFWWELEKRLELEWSGSGFIQSLTLSRSVSQTVAGSLPDCEPLA